MLYTMIKVNCDFCYYERAGILLVILTSAICGAEVSSSYYLFRYLLCSYQFKRDVIDI